MLRTFPPESRDCSIAPAAIDGQFMPVISCGSYILRSIVDRPPGGSKLTAADLLSNGPRVVNVGLPRFADDLRGAGVPVVAGGPHPTTFHGEIRGVDHFVLDEVEEAFHKMERGEVLRSVVML